MIRVIQQRILPNHRVQVGVSTAAADVVAVIIKQVVEQICC